MRYSDNVKTEGIVKNGFDYTLQAWIKNFIVEDCGHKADNPCKCNGRRLKGQDIRELLVKR